MIDTTASNLVVEINAAEDFRRSHLAGYHERVAKFHGPAYRDDKTKRTDHANFLFEYMTLMLPRIAYDNPKSHVRSSRQSLNLVAVRMKHALDRWNTLTKSRRTFRRLATDGLLGGFAVCMVVSEPMRGYRDIDDEAPFIPRAYRISPHRFFWDPAATSSEEWRYAGHVWTVDHDDLVRMAQADDSWNLDQIKSLPGGHGMTDARESLGDSRDIPERREVAIYEVWVPEVLPELMKDPKVADGVRRGKITGTLYTLVKAATDGGGKTGYLRKPRPYAGPREGPYVMVGVYDVPEDATPLSPVIAVEQPGRDHNEQLDAMHDSATSYKRLIFVDAKRGDLKRAIKNAGRDHIIPIENLAQGMVIPGEVGGITPQQIEYSQITKDRLDRISGVNDAMRGNITGEATATEVTVAEGAATMRVADIKRQFQDGYTDILTRVAWFLWYDDRVVMPLGGEAARKLVEIDPTWTGGVQGGEFDDIEIEIEAYSMERVSEALLQKRATELLNIVMQGAAAVQNAPNAPWAEIFSVVGGMLNIPNLAGMVGVGQQQQQPMQGQQPQQMPSVRPISSAADLNGSMIGGLR